MSCSDSVSYEHLVYVSCVIPHGRCQEETHRGGVSDQMSGGEPCADLKPPKPEGTLAKLVIETVFPLLLDTPHKDRRLNA